MHPPEAARFALDVLVILVLGATYVAGLTVLALLDAIRYAAPLPGDGDGDALG